MKKSFILAIDQGTTGTTVLVLDTSLRIHGKVTTEFPQHYPKPGWVEHDLNEIWTCTLNTISKAIQRAKIKPIQIVAIGITNQRETVGFWERKTGKPLGRAIVWQCRRTQPQCEELKTQGVESLIQRKTGLLLDPYFSATKINWLLEHSSPVASKVKKGNALCGTIDSYLLFRLTGGKVHATDVSNASRTSLLNLETLSWDPELLDLFGVPRAILPRVCPSAEILGKTVDIAPLPDGIPIAGMAGDQQSALFGQTCFKPGEAKCTLGTGSFLLMNTGSQKILSKHRLLTTVAWKIPSETTYALEGSVFVSGAAVQWLRDGLKLFKKSAEIEKLAAQVTDSEDLVFVPALTGLGAPHWNPNARGLITGITRKTSAAHLARATLEGLALQNYDLLHAMENDLGQKLSQLKVDGGASANNLLMQLHADLLQIPIVRPKIIETTATGAALLAGVGVGLWHNSSEIQKIWKEDRSFYFRKGNLFYREKLLNKWQGAIKKCVLESLVHS